MMKILYVILGLGFALNFMPTIAHAKKAKCDLDMRGNKFKDQQWNTMDDGDGFGVGCSRLVVKLNGSAEDYTVIWNKDADPAGDGCKVGELQASGSTVTVSLEAPETDTGPCEYVITNSKGKKVKVAIDTAGT